MKNAVVVIPTYNEVDNIKRLIPYLYKNIFPGIAGWNVSVLVVDGNSPDGTADIIREFHKKYSSLNLLVEKKKEGIGSAYFKGFQYADRKLNADVLIEFDGDFQHPPESIPVLLEKIDEGADLVLGSREVSGGSYPSNWGFKRLFLSKVGGFVARFIMFFPGKLFKKVTDPTTGLKATRVNKHFKALDFSSFINKSFGYKLEMLFRLVKSGVKVSEIPLSFKLRDGGESKIENSTAMEILNTVIKLRLSDDSTKRFIKFGTVGFLGYLINAFFVEIFSTMGFTQSISDLFTAASKFYLIRVLSQQSAWAAVFATELAIISNFILNNIWTFRKSSITGLKIIVKYLSFNLTSFGAVIIQSLTIGTATLFIGNSTFVRQTALIFSIAVLVIPYNWLIYNKIIWRVKHGS